MTCEDQRAGTRRNEYKEWVRKSMIKKLLMTIFRSTLANVPAKERKPQDDDDNDENDVVSLWIGDRRIDHDQNDWWAFNFPPNRPKPGTWRIVDRDIVVSGTQHRRDEVSTFVHEVQATQNQGQLDRFPFSVELEAEPSNRYDPNAVKVLGKTGVRSGKSHLGYLPKELAANVNRKDLPQIEITRYFERDDYNELKINIIAMT